MKKVMVMLLVVFFSGCFSDLVDERDTGLQFYKEGNEISVVIIGDSRFWEGGLWKDLPYTIYNYSYPGISTYGAVCRLKRIPFNPDIIVIGTGAIDASGYYGYDFFVIYYSELMWLLQGRKVICLEVTASVVETGQVESMNNWLIDNYFENYLELNVVPEETRDGVHFKPETFERLSALIEDRIEEIR